MSLAPLQTSETLLGSKFGGFAGKSYRVSFVFLHAHGVTHGGNIGVCLPIANHSEDDILDYFGRPEVTPILTRKPIFQPETVPPDLVPPISLAYYLKEHDQLFVESPLQVEIMDLGNATIFGEPSRPSCTSTTLYEIVFGARIFHFAAPNDALLVSMAKLCGEIPREWGADWEVRYRNDTISKTTADAEWKRRLDHYARDWTKDGIDEFITLLRAMLKMDASARPSAIEILSHPWFASC
ncbi:hypothetical protein K435DRAFT_964725 [Dendrothele bispora CBS 962.96]|uniref:Protein kinase domain-containing protein n=1 Tax=Dendrothele bispora (strain CBS 962.96) TaxID=1314807 RepID=A0A4V4HGI0_DENBC|nr:hypothetical protein K435DRAFT_964725 [Dendrothele bispora CBS 962.96]